MCAIAGILFKNGRRNTLNLTTGEALTAILDATLHRGPDSTGWALYHPPLEGQLRIRFFLSHAGSTEADIRDIRSLLAGQQADILKEETLGCTYAVIVAFDGDVLALTRALEGTTRLVSIGSSLDILKDVGQPIDLSQRYDIARFNGNHGIAHIRLATESGVHPDTSHPFWACGFSDVATVHNGQITNYWIMRRRLERRACVFKRRTTRS
jgi:glutamate synthase domain-containing protein 1